MMNYICLLWQNLLSELKLQTILIPVITTLATMYVTAIIKNKINKNYLDYKLNIEYKYEQQKKLRAMIGSYHGRILESALSLNYRIWNLFIHDNDGWLHLPKKIKQGQEMGYYIKSFAYRLIQFYSLVLEFEKKGQFIDSEIAKETDLDFIKYIKTFIRLATDASLFNGLDYDSSRQTDHFFRDQLCVICESCYIDNRLMNMHELEDSITYNKHILDVYYFLDGLKYNEERLRWDRMISLSLILMAFINSFGYKWQESNDPEFSKVLDKFKNPQVINNLLQWLTKAGLDEEKSIKLLKKSSKK